METVSSPQVGGKTSQLGLVAILVNRQPSQLLERQLARPFVNPRELFEVFIMQDHELLILSLVNI